jgi:hypothetical protein
MITFIVDYVVMIGLCFFVLPFTYFYAEEALDSEDDLEFDFHSDDEDDISTSQSAKTPKGKTSSN